VNLFKVENGDECVTVKSPTNGFVARNITCYYTAGCNIGKSVSIEKLIA
jgi:rhamnogalacturonan hydrolase